MKYYTLFGAVLAGSVFLTSACNTPQQQTSASLESMEDSVSYSIGFMQGSQLSQGGITELDIQNFIAGMQGALNEEDPEIAQMDMQNVIQVYLQQVQMEQAERQAQEGEANAEEGRQFLEENAEEEGVMVTDSGLQYRVIEEGTGERPTVEDTVEVHYRGTLVNGEEFDSSHEQGEPVTFPLGGVISGWTEGLQLMSEGSTYELFIPAYGNDGQQLGYGNNPPPGSGIPPGAVLIFEVELISIQ